MRTGWAVMGDNQHLPGYVLLLYAGVADHLTNLPSQERTDFLADMGMLGEAAFTALSRRDPAFHRLNFEILGNSWHHLHAHIHPRYRWEPHPWGNGPVWRYDDHTRNAPQHALGPQHDELKASITEELHRLLAAA